MVLTCEMAGGGGIVAMVAFVELTGCKQFCRMYTVWQRDDVQLE